MASRKTMADPVDPVGKTKPPGILLREAVKCFAKCVLRTHTRARARTVR